METCFFKMMKRNADWPQKSIKIKIILEGSKTPSPHVGYATKRSPPPVNDPFCLKKAKLMLKLQEIAGASLGTPPPSSPKNCIHRPFLFCICHASLISQLMNGPCTEKPLKKAPTYFGTKHAY